MDIYVYFVQARIKNQWLIKIGYSWNPKLRKQQIKRKLKQATDFGIVASIPCSDEWAASALERKFHKKFRKFRIFGEWFLDDSSIYELILSIRRGEYGKA